MVVAGPGLGRRRCCAIRPSRAEEIATTWPDGDTTVIPEKSDRVASRKCRGSRGRRLPGLDERWCKDRNSVERSFALLKQWRGLATRFDKLAVVYRDAEVLSAITVCLRH